MNADLLLWALAIFGLIAAIARILAGLFRTERSTRYDASDVIFGIVWLVFYIVVLAT